MRIFRHILRKSLYSFRIGYNALFFLPWLHLHSTEGASAASSEVTYLLTYLLTYLAPYKV